MSTLQPGNEQYTKVQDSVYDSKVLLALSKSNVIPKTLRTFRSTINLVGQASASTVVYPLEDEDGNQIQLYPGQQIILQRADPSTAIAASSGVINVNLTLNVGVGNTTTALDSTLTSAVGQINTIVNGTGLGLTGVALGHGAVVQQPNTAGDPCYLLASVVLGATTAAISAGKLELFIMVV
jgi:hypothetical protein